jgi:DNA-binding beta-propeller fold protein YncE
MTTQIAPPQATSPASFPQLTLEIDSAGARNTIYVTADASVNDITLVIGTTAEASFTPATTIPDKSGASTASGSLLYLDLSPLNLTSDEFDAISPHATGWHIEPFADDQLLGMSPESDITLDPGDAIDISIGALAAAQATGSTASLTVTAYRVGGITVGNLGFPTNFSVALATPPVGGESLSEDLMVALTTPDIVNTIPGYDPINNQLAFAFYAGQRGRPVTPTADSQFTLSFVYASDPSGYGALCTPAEVKPPFAVVAGVNAGTWHITPNLAQESPSWTLKPPTTGPIVSSGPGSTVGILANNLVTTFQPGPTVALITYSGFPGYADGVFTLPISKHAHVRIDSLTVKPNPTVLDHGAANVKVAWTVENAGTMTLAPFDQDVTGTQSYDATITDTTPITLTAQGTVLANNGNIAIANVTANVLPVINSFDASPRAVFAGDLPKYVDLSWNVNTNDQLQLLSSTEPPDPEKYDAVGTVSKLIEGPQMFTLVPLGQAAGPTVERSIIVSAFVPEQQAWPVAASSLAAPPNASFIVASDGNSTVTAVDTMVYQPVSAGVPAGKGPAGMVFSADGSTLYVANSGDGTVSAINVGTTGSVPQYSFTTRSTIAVGNAPQRLALSPDGHYLYVTTDGGLGTGSLVVVATSTGAVVDSLSVGVAPRGVAVMPSGAQIFVANSGSSTVTVIGRSKEGEHSVVDTITGVSLAQDVAVTPDGGVLLVTCPTANAVIAINSVYPQAPRATLKTGASPQQIALIPGGGYAMVTNQGDSSVALLSLGQTPPQCSVVGAGISVGQSPNAVAVTPDAGLALVGTSGSPGLQVLTLAEYQTAEAHPGIGGQPTGVAVAPGGKTAVGWHDARLSFSIGKPSTGLFVYDVVSETVAPQLAKTAVVDFAYAPTTPNTAFMVTKSQPAVEVLNTETWAVASSIDLTGHTTGVPVALTPSSDGSTLFVLTVDESDKCELVVFGAAGSPPTYSVLATVTVMASGESGSALTLAAAPDGSAAYVTDEASGNLLVVTRDAGGSYALRGNPVSVGTLPSASALSPDGTELYVANSGMTNGTLAAIDTATLSMRSVVLPSNSLMSLAGLVVAPDGSRVLAADMVAAGVRIFDAASLRLVQTIPWTSGVEMPTGIAVAADGSRIFTANTSSANLGVITQVQAGATKISRRPAIVSSEIEPLAEDVGDDTYQGLFIRDYVGQTPTSGNQTGSVVDCPDLWAAGQQPLPDPQTTLVGSYQNTDSPNIIYTSQAGVNNYIYVRGQNTVNGANTSRVWLYYVNGGGDPSLLLWPPSWLSNGIQALNTGKPYIEVSSSALAEIDFTNPPFLWDAVPVSGHYCMVAWVENPPLSDPPVDPRGSIGSIGTMDQLAAFIANHPQMGWKNTSDQPTPTGESWEYVLPFDGPRKGGLFKAGLQFTNMNTDAFFSFSIVGPTVNPPRTIPPSVNIPKTPITSADQSYLVPLDWTGANSYKTQMVVTFYAGPTPMQQGANVQAQAASMGISELVGLVPDPLARARRLRVYPTHHAEDGFQEEWLTIVGGVQVNAMPPS